MTMIKKLIAACLLLLSAAFLQPAIGQNSNDAIMMNKGQFCNGISFANSSWTKYWEGTHLRDNQNIGRFTAQTLMLMSNFGISDKLNIMAGLPYVSTRASAGTLHGMKGFQDISLDIKWKPISMVIGQGRLSLFLVGGFSAPLSNYSIDLLPMSIGVGSTNMVGRVMLNYGMGIFFIRVSAAHIWRSNVTLDRTAYYTTSMHLTNEVEMPDQAFYNGSIGIHKKFLIAEAEVNNLTTLGGYDIRKNDMPFPSNRMNSTDLQAHVKYTIPAFTHLSLDGMFSYVVAGRNLGQATSFTVGAYYVFDFDKKSAGDSNKKN